VAESCTISSSRSRRPVRKLLDTPSYFNFTLWDLNGRRRNDSWIIKEDHKTVTK